MPQLAVMGKEHYDVEEQTSWAETGDQELGAGSVDNNLCGSPGAIMMQMRGDGDQGTRAERILDLF